MLPPAEIASRLNVILAGGELFTGNSLISRVLFVSVLYWVVYGRAEMARAR